MQPTITTPSVVYKIPDKCPYDGAPLKRDGVYVRCINTQCGAAQINMIRHFVSRNAFNIEGMGSKIVERFLDEGRRSWKRVSEKKQKLSFCLKTEA